MVKKELCPKGCGRKFFPSNMGQHLEVCGRATPPPSRNYTLSPDEAAWPNSRIRCALCVSAPLIKHADGTSYYSCAKWDDPLHRDREAARQVGNERVLARRAVGGHVMTQARGVQIIKWLERIAALGCSRKDELVAWLGENPDWRADDTVDRADSLEALALRLEITTYSNYMGRLDAELSKVDPANVPTLTGGQDYSEICKSVDTLARYPGSDPMFGGISPLTSLLTCGTVESSLSVLVERQLLRVRAPMRKAASGAKSHLAVSKASRSSTDTRGLGLIARNLRESGVLMGSSYAQRRRWLDLGFGLGVKVDGMRILVQRLPSILRIADGKAVATLDCDFGGQANNVIHYQALNVKLDYEDAIGDATTRLYTRPANNAIADVLSRVGRGDRMLFHVCRHGQNISEYTIDCADWRDQLGLAAIHHLQTHDDEVYKQLVAADPPGWARQWTGKLLEKDGCGGVLYGVPISFIVNDETYGRCPYTDRVFRCIADALDRTACLIALGRDYDWNRDQPRDNTSILPAWAGDQRAREVFLRAAAPHAYDAVRIVEVEILPRVETAFADENGDVGAALQAGYAAVAHGAQTMGARAFLDDVHRRYMADVAPRVLDKLRRERRFEITTYNLRDLDAGPVGRRYHFVPRTGLDDLLGAPDTSRLPAVPASPGRGDVDALTSAVAASPGNFQSSSDDDDAALPDVPKSRTRTKRSKARRRRPPDGSTQPDSTARSLGAGGLPPVL